MAVNSNRKGKAGEREAATYLRGLGYHDARRSQQHNGIGLSDVVAPETLPGLTIEVKRVGDPSSFRPGSRLHQEACEQAARDADGGRWVVLWRPSRSHWWSATVEAGGMLVSVAGDDVPKLLQTFRPDGRVQP